MTNRAGNLRDFRRVRRGIRSVPAHHVPEQIMAHCTLSACDQTWQLVRVVEPERGGDRGRLIGKPLHPCGGRQPRRQGLFPRCLAAETIDQVR